MVPDKHNNSRLFVMFVLSSYIAGQRHLLSQSDDDLGMDRILAMVILFVFTYTAVIVATPFP